MRELLPVAAECVPVVFYLCFDRGLRDGVTLVKTDMNVSMFYNNDQAGDSWHCSAVTKTNANRVRETERERWTC